MQLAVPQGCEGLVDQTVALQSRQPREALRHNAHTKVPSAAGTAMAGMRGAVVLYLQLRGLQSLSEQTLQSVGAAALHRTAHRAPAPMASAREASQAA